jgi:hypothetical protein
MYTLHEILFHQLDRLIIPVIITTAPVAPVSVVRVFGLLNGMSDLYDLSLINFSRIKY